MINDRILVRDCLVTIVPDGEEVWLEKGTVVSIMQTLGGTVTVRNSFGLFRIAGRDLDALGDEAIINQFKFKDGLTDDDEPFSEERVWQALRNCYDPEIPINIVDLGLVYDLSITTTSLARFNVKVKMTLTAQGCGMGPVIAADAKEKIEALPAVEAAEVEIVWDPIWNPMMISEAGQKTLGLC